MVTWAALTALLAVRAFADGVLRGRSGPIPIGRPELVDLNRATIGELCALPGIGPGRAAAIVLERVRHGPFRAVDDLARVDGIGGETIEGLRAHALASPLPAAR